MPEDLLDDAAEEDAADPEAKAEVDAEDAEETPDVPEDNRFVRYIGTADERRLTASDFARHGVQVEAGVAWNRSNGFRVRLDALDFLDDEAFARFITSDAGFVVEEPAER